MHPFDVFLRADCRLKLLDRQMLRNGSLQDNACYARVNIEIHNRRADFDFRNICREIAPSKTNSYFLCRPFLIADV